MRGMDSFSTGDLPAAIAVWQKALTVDPSDQKVVGYLTRAQEQLARTREILGQTQKQGAGKR
jgi:cytochrome c-type biogenesis protein CcmH/NrfG